jgi:sensor histidine kinase YesM
MKKLILLSALLFSIYCSFASELPLLNLEVGKTYTIETINHIDTTAQNPKRDWDQCKWLFTPISYNSSTQTYRMKAVLDYYQHVVQKRDTISGWKEKEVYETGYLESYRSQLVFLNANKIPIYFDITKEGIVSSFDFSKYNNYTSPEGIQLYSYVEEEQYLGRNIQMIFFHNPISVPLNKYAHLLYIDLNPEKSYYKYVCQDSISVTLDMIPTINNPSVKLVDFINERLSIDKKTGLILQRHINYCYPELNCAKNNTKCEIFSNNATYYQKYIPEYHLDKRPIRIYCNGEWKDTLIAKANTLIKCKITKRIAGEDSVDVLLDGNENNCQRLALDKNNEIETGFFLVNPAMIQIRYPRVKWGNSYHEFQENLNNSIYNFQVAAGDNLNLELWMNGSSLDLLSVKGIYSTLFKHEREFGKLANHPLSDVNLSMHKEDYLPYMNEYRLNADPRIYLNKLFGIIYQDEIIKIMDFRDKLSKLPQSFDQDNHKLSVKNNIIINNTLAKTSNSYLQFLIHYLNYFYDYQIQNAIGTYLSSSRNIIENRYYLGQSILAEPVRSNYLCYFILDVLHNGDYEKVTGLYESFMQNYPGTSSSLALKNEFDRNSIAMIGAAAPNFILKDIYGKKYSLRDFKKKVILLHFNEIPWNSTNENIHTNDHLISRLQQISNNTNNDLVNIFILNGNNTKLIEQIKNYGYKGIFLIDGNELFANNSKVENIYFAIFNDTEILIDRNGRIVKRSNFWQQVITDEDITNALAIPYQRSYLNLPFLIRITLISLIAALLAIAVTFLLYRNITRRKIKKSELNKRMRELELSAIRAQMNPHFMYNCLNSIQNLVLKNQNEEAHLYLSKFAGLIRQVLNTSKKEEISLYEELETVNNYIELEKLRFEFEYHLEIDQDIESGSVFLPPMLLQPIVENALLHGLFPKPSDRKLTITISSLNNMLTISIEDNGVGRTQSTGTSGSGNGKGLEFTRERLLLLSGKYKAKYDMRIDDLTDNNGQPSGTKVMICLEEE